MLTSRQRKAMVSGAGKFGLTKNMPGLELSFLVCLLFLAVTGLSQSGTGKLPALPAKASFGAGDFAALHRGEAIVSLLPQSDKREVAVYGLIDVNAGADEFLKSYIASMTNKNNGAIQEVGRFGSTPSVDDLDGLTIDGRDLEDLKKCVAGDCALKLSTDMIARFQKEVDWHSPNYVTQATNLYKQIIVSYVADYIARGDESLIQYGDKSKAVQLGDEQRDIMAATRNEGGVLSNVPADDDDAARQGFSRAEDAIVWSKVKFGFKPVLAINHIRVFRRESGAGLQQEPQVLIASKQIYANHYFDSSLGLTALATTADNKSYLVYENRSRIDGFGGMLGKLKRGIIEEQAVDGLRSILQHTKAKLESHGNETLDESVQDGDRGWKDWKIAGVRVYLGLFWLAVLAGLGIMAYRIKLGIGAGQPLNKKPV